MVTHINFPVEDDMAERARAVKEETGWSWPQYFEEATERFEEELAEEDNGNH